MKKLNDIYRNQNQNHQHNMIIHKIKVDNFFK